MKYALHFVPKALNDLAEIRAYIAADNPSHADVFAQKLWGEIQSLKEMPNRCSLAPEASRTGRELRHFLVGDYRILFVVKGGAVKILRVIHGARAHFNIGHA